MKDYPQKFAPAQRELVIEVWQRLRRPSVGRRELRTIQSAFTNRFGAVKAPSPASIARLLADEGAELRHPEVIEFDARWREHLIENDLVADVGNLESQATDEPLRIATAETFIKKLEELQRRFQRASDRRALRQVREFAIAAKQAARSLAKSRTLDQAARNEQAEIAEWLTVWIQTPDLFQDWLELRQRSADFRKRFVREKDR